MEVQSKHMLPRITHLVGAKPHLVFVYRLIQKNSR
jgi:hypothetical protein